MNTELHAGFEYLVEVVSPDGSVRDCEVVHNLMPAEGLNHVVGVTLKGSSQITSWYVGVFEGNYTPAVTDTAADFPTAATESTAYSEVTRQALTLGSVSGGAVSNSASRAEFTFAGSNRTIYGGFISSASAKGATTGPLLSAVRFTSPKVVGGGDVLRVTTGFNLVSG